jgi:hypothetical protein
MRIQIAKDRGVSYKGDHLEGGEQYEVDDVFGMGLVADKRAEEVDERETVAAHRDSTVRRATRG